MPCCIGDTLRKLQALQSRLERKGETREAAKVKTLQTRIATAARKLQSRMPEAEGESDHLDGPAGLDKYYEECKKNPPQTAKGDVKSYCAKVAWSIYCTHVNPGHEGCTSKGKDLNK